MQLHQNKNAPLRKMIQGLKYQNCKELANAKVIQSGSLCTNRRQYVTKMQLHQNKNAPLRKMFQGLQ